MELSRHDNISREITRLLNRALRFCPASTRTRCPKSVNKACDKLRLRHHCFNLHYVYYHGSCMNEQTDISAMVGQNS